MKWLAVFLVLFPACSFALPPISGMDDTNPNITYETQLKLDDAIMTYYQHPTRQKVETVLDIMNNTDLLRKKTAWAPMVGFLTIVFGQNQQHLFAWMGRNNYNQYAEDIIITALLHNHFKETALVFAQAHQWKKSYIDRIRYNEDKLDLKFLNITNPGHIDTLWGAFFASGDKIYVYEIIEELYKPDLTREQLMKFHQEGDDTQQKTLFETRKLAQNTLKQYAPYDPVVREAIQDYLKKEKDMANWRYLRSLLPDKKAIIH